MKKMYVVVRKDLPTKYSAVQGGHGLAEYLLKVAKKEPSFEWHNGTLVYLRVRNEHELVQLHQTLMTQAYQHAIFREPDLDNALTALVGLGDTEALRSLPLF